MHIGISRIGSNETIRFAASELCRYLKSVEHELFVREGVSTFWRDGEDCIWIGIDPAFDTLLLPVKDKKVDDAIYINVKNGKGIITGTNPRSVLIAVYRYLKELGFSWVRPGFDGEMLPEKLDFGRDVEVCEAASYRHRAVCIEGAVSYEHVKNVIDWIPKASMNGYYIQFRVPFTFFDRWYNHKDNPLLEKEGVGYENVVEMMRLLEEEIAMRDLVYHTVGHGWTCEPFGIKGLGWDKVDDEISDEVREKLALVNGKRELWGGVPLNTSLCYSNPEVRALMSDSVLEYCKNNPRADYVHVWLADGANNNCECEECKKKRPSDYYVMLLNEIDRKLTENGINTKVVFLLYLDLLWVFEEEKIKNKDRFLMMFAPITRSYTTKYSDFDEKENVTLSPYVRNKLMLPKRVEENVAHLRSWQAEFDGDSVDFDYHLMWDHHKDPGYYRCSEILFADVQGLDKIGLNGYISCQLQRAAFPTGLPMEMMAQGLWDKTCDFETAAKKYFADAFGPESEKVREYLKALSGEFVPAYARGELEAINPAVAESVVRAKKRIGDFAATIDENIIRTEGNVCKSWEYLKYHSKLNCLYADMVITSARGDVTGRAEAAKKVVEYACEIEMQVNHVFDVCLYIHGINSFLTDGRLEA